MLVQPTWAQLVATSFIVQREREIYHLPAPYVLIIHLNANLLHVSWLPLIFFMPTSRIHLLCRSAASSWSSSLFCNQHSIRDSGCVSVKVTVYCLMTRLKTGIWSASETRDYQLCEASLSYSGALNWMLMSLISMQNGNCTYFTCRLWGVLQHIFNVCCF